MKLVVSGSSGLLGSAICRALHERGDVVVRLVRDRCSANDQGMSSWNPRQGNIDPGAFAGADAVIHLAGESIAGGRWSRARKERILASRIDSTRLIVSALHEIATPPLSLLCASAVGFYGHRADQSLDEASAPGLGFLPEVCRHWEAAAQDAQTAGVRVVHLRFGMVLSAAGGALKAMLPAFRYGLGGTIGDGRQYLSWISREDAVRAVLFCLGRAELSGAVNVVAPNPVTNREFTRSLGRALHRPALFSVPAFLMKTVLGQMAEELLLASCRAFPGKLLEHGFAFSHPTLAEAFGSILG